MHYKYFVGHKAPDFPMWPGFTFFEHPKDSPAGTSYRENMNEDSIFSEYSSLFNLKRKLRESGAGGSDLITICQHRRFVLNIRKGSPAENLPANIIPPGDMLHLNFGPELFPRKGQSYLVGSVMALNLGMMHQYARAHHVRDILRFCSDLIDAGLMTNEEAEDFLTQKILIPAPNCGTFEVSLFLEMMDFVESAAEVYWDGGYRTYDDIYQFRVVSFLLERLNSWILLRRIVDKALNFNSISGFTTIVSSDSVIKRGGTNRPHGMWR